MWFSIDINKLVVLLAQTFLRKPRLLALLQSLTTPIATLQQQWYKKRLDNIYKLKHNGQVCYLKKAINDDFDASLRRIKIADGNKYERVYLYANSEKKQPKLLGKTFLRPVGDYADTGADFRVIVPQGFDFTNNIYQLRALIDFYKLAGKRYLIEVDE